MGNIEDAPQAQSWKDTDHDLPVGLFLAECLAVWNQYIDLHTNPLKLIL